MKQLLYFAFAMLIFFACSSPKQYYAFSTYKYQSKNTENELEKLEPIPPNENTISASSGESLSNAPESTLSEEEVSNIVLNKLTESNPVINSKVEEINEKYKDMTLAEEGDRAIRKEVRKDMKVLRKEIKKEVKENRDEYAAFLEDIMPQSDGSKNQLVALLLVLLVGGLSIHRFYLGYVWQGIAQIILFIVGIFFWPVLIGWGIWWLIDLIRIITGDLGPNGGTYAKTL
jgi:TM2 domain-containing membrane protein YozV